MNSSIEVRLLGPLEVVVDGPRRRVRRCQATALFVALALRAPDAVSVDELVEVVWSDEAPDGRGQALQKQVSRLRARVGEQLPVRRQPAGYVLDIERESIDCRRFETLLERARNERSTADPAAAAEQLATALALWRGPALADHRFDDFAQGEIARLEELHLEAIEERLDGRAGPRPGRRSGRRAARAGRRAPAARAAARPADARALPRRTPGGRAGGDARGPPVAGRRARP